MFVFLFAIGALPSLKRGWRHKFLLLVLDFVSKEEINFRESGKFVRFCENLLLLMTQCEKCRQDLFSRTEKKKIYINILNRIGMLLKTKMAN